MSPENRLAGLFAALDRLPAGARRALTAAIPIALVAVLVAAFVLAAHGQHHHAARTAAAQPPAAATPTPPRRENPMPPVGSDAAAQPVTAAIDPARRFIESYVAFSYGHGRVNAVRAADPQLRRTFADQRPRVPPAQRKRHPTVAALRVVEYSPGVAKATATIADGAALRYTLVFYLDHRPGGWLVTRMAD